MWFLHVLLFYTSLSFCDWLFLGCVSKENDIFLGWEKGTGKKWGKSKKKGGTDLSLEEMKKQAAVQCLRSASDEVSIDQPDSYNPVSSVSQIMLLYYSFESILFWRCANQLLLLKWSRNSLTCLVWNFWMEITLNTEGMRM